MVGKKNKMANAAMTVRDTGSERSASSTSMPPQRPGAETQTRALDLTITIVALVILLPLLVVIACLLKLTSKGPVLYAHNRIGAGGKMFPCYKFRSMVVNSDEVLAHHLANSQAARLEWERDQKLRDDPRVTMVGRMIRRTSLDELPQLINVLRGDMSIVGPRPVTKDELRKYGHYAKDY
jgi:exopolysaccharide production protein ExoY